MNSAIIVAAGIGARFGSKTPKQFIQLNGKPLIIHTLQRFDDCPEINEIILVLSSKETSSFLKLAKVYPFKKLSRIVSGGATRAESVIKGFQSILRQTSNIVVIHDGARPLVSIDEISQTVAKAQKTGAACLVGSVTDTIKKVQNGEIIETIDRNILRRALTPQAFSYDILKRAFDENEINDNATDECYLVEKLGVKIAIVEGSPQNIKITNQEDLIIAKALLNSIK